MHQLLLSKDVLHGFKYFHYELQLLAGYTTAFTMTYTVHFVVLLSLVLGDCSALLEGRSLFVQFIRKKNVESI